MFEIVRSLKEAAEQCRLSDVFFDESPSRVLYYLEVAHSLLLPAHHVAAPSEFQVFNSNLYYVFIIGITIQIEWSRCVSTNVNRYAIYA